jgi:Raf kinase inhibitor-like YbhB/YbcL family protein
MSTLRISSPAFQHQAHIPARYTCDGSDINPPLIIENIPTGAQSLALIVDDPDAPAGTWVHWVVWNIKPDTREIKEHSVPPGASEGMNDFRKRSYGGPCPPGGTHRYFFKLYALDATLTLGSQAAKADLERAMKGHILAQAELVGLYART